MDTLHVDTIPPVFLCDTGTVNFNPQILSFVADSLGMPLAYHWDFGTGNSGDTANARNTSFDYKTPGAYVAQLQVQSPIGCTATAIDSVQIIRHFVMQSPGDTTICIGNSVPLKAYGGDSYIWSPAESLNKTQGDSVVATPKETTPYTVIGTDRYHCFSDTGNFTITVLPLPEVSIDPVEPILPGTSVTLGTTVSPDVVSWDWAPPTDLSCTNCTNPVTTPKSPTTYTVTVTTAGGCVSTASMTIRLLCSESAVHMANAFSPNHDGNNDLFYPVGSGVKIIRTFQVYSRWGQLLYSRKDMPANDKSFGWDGNLNGTPQPAGTYVYMAEIECFTGETFLLKGTVELLR